MNINKTHRLTIVDRKCQVYQLKRVENKVQLKATQSNNLFKIISQDSKKAA